MHSVLMVCTRKIPLKSENGRERTMSFIRRSLEKEGRVKIYELRSILENKSIGQLGFVILKFILSVVRGHPLPLQSLLFYDRLQYREIEDFVGRERPSTVYFDGVRSGVLSISLRKKYPKLRIVCDFDDLMSRRMQVLNSVKAPISMGYLSKSVPPWIQAYLLDGLLGRMVKKYEKFALISVEKRIAATCDNVVLVSSVDAEELLKFARASVEVIPPFMPAPRFFDVLQPFKRFVFIGSDRLLQNRLSIEFLVNLWGRASPKSELHIFGNQSQQYKHVPGIVFHGFVKDLDEVYSPGSVLLAPAFLSGGVKTKVLEAMAYGVVPLGTSITFEGINAPYNGLVYSGNEWEDVVCDPMRFSKGWNEAGQHMINVAMHLHSSDHLADRWCHVIWPN